jgi:hypothetical protein
MTMTTMMMRTVKISIYDQQCRRLKHTDYAQADPLLPASSPCLLDGSVELSVSFPYIFGNFFAFLFDLGDSRFLLDNQGLEVLEELGQLHHLLFDFLDILMSSPDILCDPRCFATSIALDKLRSHEYR